MRDVPKWFLVMGLGMLALAVACGPAQQPPPPEQVKPAEQIVGAGLGKGQTLDERLNGLKKLISMSSSELRKVTGDELLQGFTPTWPCEGPGKRGAVLKRATSADFPHMDPTYLTIDGFMQHANSVHSRVIMMNSDCARFNHTKPILAPDLAKSWEFSPDNKKLTFKLYEGIKWHNKPPVNGREFTSDDIKWTFDHYKTAQGSIHKAGLDVIESIETPDKYTLVFNLKQPAWYLLDRLTGFRQLVILAREQAEQQGDFRRDMIGTGPFQLRDYRENVEMVFERNPDFEKRADWTKGRPYLDGIHVYFIKDEAQQIAAYRSGQVHYTRAAGFTTVGDMVGVLKTRPDSHVQVEAPFQGSFRIGMRLDKKPFDDVRVRRALSLAIDRQAVLDQIYDGRGVILPYFPWNLAMDREPTREDLGPWYRFDVKKAKELLAEAGYSSGFTVNLTFFRYGSYVPDSYAIVKEDWKQIGVTLNIQEQDYALYNNLLAKADYEQAINAWGPSGADADTYFYETLHSKSPNNRYRVNDPKVDDLVTRIRAEMDGAKRKALVKQVWDWYLDQVPFPTIAGGLSLRIYDAKIRNHRGLGGGADNRAISMDHGAQMEHVWLAQ